MEIMGAPGCNIEKSLNIIGGKWSTLIVRDLMEGPKRFKDLRKSLEGISPTSLINKLRKLEENQVIKREIFAEVPPKVEYSLTEYGMALKGVLSALDEWGRLEPPVVSYSKEND